MFAKNTSKVRLNNCDNSKHINKDNCDYLNYTNKFHNAKSNDYYDLANLELYENKIVITTFT